MSSKISTILKNIEESEKEATKGLWRYDEKENLIVDQDDNLVAITKKESRADSRLIVSLQNALDDIKKALSKLDKKG